MTIEELQEFIGKSAIYKFTDTKFTITDFREYQDTTILVYGDNGIIIDYRLVVLEENMKPLMDQKEGEGTEIVEVWDIPKTEHYYALRR